MKKINIILDIILLVLYLVVAILSIINAIKDANDKMMLIGWIVAAICWGSCFVLDIIKLSTKYIKNTKH